MMIIPMPVIGSSSSSNESPTESNPEATKGRWREHGHDVVVDAVPQRSWEVGRMLTAQGAVEKGRWKGEVVGAAAMR